MTPFLTHLVGTALGATSPEAARVSLPPRFAPALDSPSSEGETRVPDRLPDREPVGPRVEDRNGQSLVETATPAPPRESGPLQRPHRDPPVNPGTTAHFDMRTASSSVTSSRPRETAPGRGDAVLPAMPVGVQLPAVRYVASPVEAADQPTGPGIPRSAPLSAAAVASRVVSHEDGPVIQVTIDRIDVRGPSEVAPSAPRRHQRHEPALSLRDYLRGTGSRT